MWCLQLGRQVAGQLAVLDKQSSFPACVDTTSVAYTSDGFWQWRFRSLSCILYYFTVRVSTCGHFSAALGKAASSTNKKQYYDIQNTSLSFLFFFCSPQFPAFQKSPSLFCFVFWLFFVCFEAFIEFWPPFGFWLQFLVSKYFHLDLLLKWKRLFEIVILRFCFWTV